MKRGYNPGELEHCASRSCPEKASVIIHKRIGLGKEAKDKQEVLYAYCPFHALIAEQMFGTSQSRVEVKGIIC